MFKGKSTIHRHKILQGINSTAKATIQLSPRELLLIENTTVISLTEKIELLSIALGHKLTGELFSSILYIDNASTGQEEATPESIDAIDFFLQQLSFPYYKDSAERTSRTNPKWKILTWFQVCLNEKVKIFMQDFANELTDIEEGVLYGYPQSAIQAFAGLIEPDHTTKSESIAKKYIGAGIPSQYFADEEEAYYLKQWNELRDLSKKLVMEAERFVV